VSAAAGSAAPVNIALIGCGAMGERVAAQVYARADEASYRLAAAIDPAAGRARAVGDALGVPAYPSAEAALAAGTRIDAADIRTPHAAHADAACDALRRSWHVLIEKPLATSVADGERIRQAAAASGRMAAVAENYPHLQAVRAAADAVRAGKVGEVLGLRTTRAYTLGGVWLRDGWRRDGGPSAGLLLDQGTHHTSLHRFLGGPVSRVAAEASGPDRLPPGRAADGETLMLTIRFASGLAAQSLYSWAAFPLEPEAEASVFGSRGRIDIRVSYDAGQGGAYLWDGAGGTPISPPENYYDSHRLIIEDWVSAIRTGGRPLVSVADAQADLAVVLAARRSLETGGRPVTVAAGPP
jgi:UDP-N-acetyl-2-amino-2-deoxyglucuronate dehydrogenase